MIATNQNTHVVFLHRGLVQRMQVGADARAHNTWSPERSRKARSFSNYLEQSLRVRGDLIEIKGPMHWIRELVEVCGDARAALAIGMQLAGE